MGEGELQRLMTELLRPMLARFLVERGETAHVGANQFIYWSKFAPTRSIAPDIYVLPGVPQSRVERIWKLWEEPVVPSFCLEIVSSDVDKDYRQIPAACAEIGVSELVIFDPDAAAATSSERVTWQVYRRKKKEHLKLVLRSDRPTIRSEQLGCWLTLTGEGGERRIRVARDANGRDLYPTDEEALRVATAERDALEAEVKDLRARLAGMKRKRVPRAR